ncbi:MAG: glycosyltransferase family 2 protein [Candidatus Izemoplasmataceae bacterium]
MKWISFIVPAYNSEKYLNKCIDSLLVVIEDAEIVIINDGSTDHTEKIALDYQAAYPNAIKVVSKANGGHGSGINKGVEVASGKYFKVVDSDDWLNEDGIKDLVYTIKNHQLNGIEIDMYLTNFVYDKPAEQKQFVRQYHKQFKPHTVLAWEQVKRFKFSSVILMHAITYKTELLRAFYTPLPHHTFYVDNIYAYQMLPYIHTIYYTNKLVYHYYIGRADQSVNRMIFVNRYEQQIRVMHIMLSKFSYNEIVELPKPLKRYMFFCLSIIMIVTTLFTTANTTYDRKVLLESLWNDLKEKDEKLYKKLAFRSRLLLINWLPWRVKGLLMTTGYKLLNKMYHFG